MKKYLETLITEKGKQLDDEIKIKGQIGLTYQHLIDFIEQCPGSHKEIKNTLTAIDFQNGDVFHYLNFLAEGMVKALEHQTKH